MAIRLVTCTDCGNKARSEDSVCSDCGGFLAGSPEPSLGVFSTNAHLDTASDDIASDDIASDDSARVESSMDLRIDLDLSTKEVQPSVPLTVQRVPAGQTASDTVLVVERKRSDVDSDWRSGLGDTTVVTAPVAQVPQIADKPSDVEAEVAAVESAWPVFRKILLGIFYVLFVIAVAIVVNKILRAL